MIKKIFVFMAAFFVMLLSCAGPCMINSYAAANDFSSFSAFRNYIGWNFTDIDDYYYAYFSFNYDSNKTTGVCIHFRKSDHNKYNIVFNNNILTIACDSISSFNTRFANSDSSHDWEHYNYLATFNFDNGTCQIADKDGVNFTPEQLYTGLSSFSFDNFETNLEEYQPEELDLSVSFNPSMSGTVSRNQTINGKEYESKTLDLSISNNGSTAQWAMFIVPHGETVSFPSTTLEDNKGFTGNPVFVYVADEWSSFNVGMTGSAVYAPCSWHTIPAGFQNQTYSISWSQMCLQANTEYDVIVYGCLNATALQTNTSSQWEMRPVYTVSSDLSGVEQVYKSTFTISDPAEFNPNYVDESGASHSWNPNTDNSNLFNVSSAYRDDYGNIVIRGQTNGGNNVLSPGLSVDNMNVNAVFGDTFKFFFIILGMFPPAWAALIYIGLASIVVIVIVKRVTKND